MQMIRLFWDAAAELDPAARELDEAVRFADLANPEGLRRSFEDAGLRSVETRSTTTDGGLFGRGSGSCCPRNPTGASTCSRGHGPSGARSSRGSRAGGAVRQRAGYGWRVIDAAHGLRASEVAERVARGEVNRLPPPNTRTYGQIVRANVLTRFNALLGGMLMLILIVGPLQDALF